MKLFFECEKCGNRKGIEKPIVTKIKCDCGGVMGISTIQPRISKNVQKNDMIVINPDDEPTTLISSILQIKIPHKKLSENLYKYKTVMCPKCGKIQVTTAEECFRCRWCNKVSYYMKKGIWNVKFKDFPTNEMACIFAKRWSESLACGREIAQSSLKGSGACQRQSLCYKTVK